MTRKHGMNRGLATLIAATLFVVAAQAVFADTSQVFHRTVEIDGLSIFYREAGPAEAPTLLLLHGFPTSSHMFRDLIPALADEFHLVAPDYPGYGNSSMPALEEFDYSFDHLAEIIDKFTVKLGLDRFSMYLMDYGAPTASRMSRDSKRRGGGPPADVSEPAHLGLSPQKTESVMTAPVEIIQRF